MEPKEQERTEGEVVARFGFFAEWRKSYDPDHAAGWAVGLPHQCDAWDIAGDYYRPASHAEAAAGLERFLAEGQDVLERLRRGEATPGD